jgi:hypothetical protein
MKSQGSTVRVAFARWPVACLTVVMGLLVGACDAGHVETDLADELALDNAELASRGAVMAEVQDAIADCMRDAGFDYTPYLPSIDTSLVTAIRAVVLAGSDVVFTRTYGYGISESQRSSLVDFLEDPNRDVIRARSSNEQTAYTSAFDRCNSDALAAEGIDVESIVSVNEDFSAAVEALDAQILSDQDVVELQRDWSSCIQAKGFRFNTLTDAVKAVRDAADARSQRIDLDQGSHDALHEVEDAFADLLDLEVEIANADVACRDEVGLSEVLDEVRRNHERQFLTDNGELIRGFRNPFG